MKRLRIAPAEASETCCDVIAPTIISKGSRAIGGRKPASRRVAGRAPRRRRPRHRRLELEGEPEQARTGSVSRSSGSASTPPGAASSRSSRPPTATCRPSSCQRRRDRPRRAKALGREREVEWPGHGEKRHARTVLCRQPVDPNQARSSADHRLQEGVELLELRMSCAILSLDAFRPSVCRRARCLVREGETQRCGAPAELVPQALHETAPRAGRCGRARPGSPCRRPRGRSGRRRGRGRTTAECARVSSQAPTISPQRKKPPDRRT